MCLFDFLKSCSMYDFSKLSDGMGKECRMALWNHPGNDVTGMLARSEKVVNTCEKVFLQ